MPLIERIRGGFTFGLDVLAQEPFGEHRDGRRATIAGLIGGWIAAVSNRSEGFAREIAGLIWRVLAQTADRQALCWRAAAGAGAVLHDVARCAARAHSHAEAGKIGIPNEMFFARRFEGID